MNTDVIWLMRRAVVHSLVEARRMRAVQAVGIEANPSAAADVSAEAVDTVGDRAIYLGLREVPHRSPAVNNATAAEPLIVHGTRVVALVEIAIDARDAAVRPRVIPAAVRRDIYGIGSAAVIVLTRLDMGLIRAGVSYFVVCPSCASAGLTRGAANTPGRSSGIERGFQSPASVLVVKQYGVIGITERDIVHVNRLGAGLSRRRR